MAESTWQSKSLSVGALIRHQQSDRDWSKTSKVSLQTLPHDVVKQDQSGVGGVKGHERLVMGHAELQTEKEQASGQDFLQQEPEVGGPLWESGRRCLSGDTRTKPPSHLLPQ